MLFKWTEQYLKNNDVFTESFVTEVGLIKRIRDFIKGKNKSKDESDEDEMMRKWKEKAKNRDIESLKMNICKYKRNVVTSKSNYDVFYRNNDFLIECVTGDDQMCQVLANLLFATYDINTPVQIYVTDGKSFNKAYDLYGDNAYTNNVHHIIIPLDTLKNTDDIVSAKSTLGARYFNDVVDNNEYREYLAGRHEKSEQIQSIIDALGERDN